MGSGVQTQTRESITYDSNGKPMVVLKNSRCKATQTTPRWDLLSKDPNEPLAIDIEFQECKREGAEKWHHRIGRIAFVNTKGDTIYDTYVRYEDEKDLAAKVNPRFGVTWRDLKIQNGAQPIQEVEWDLSKIMCGRIIIGHGMRLDIGAIEKKLWDGVEKIVDTQHIYGQVGLGKLVDRYLHDIEFTWHDPTHDAKATMLLYLRKYSYKNRTEFKESFIYEEEDFPALGAAPAKKRR